MAIGDKSLFYIMKKQTRLIENPNF